MARKGGGRRPGAPPADEAALFREAMRDVKPFRRDESVPAPARTKRPSAEPVTRTLPPPPSVRPTPPPPGPDLRTSQRLRRGQMRPEARLDLHGMTQIEAHAALRSFLGASRAAGRRCVLIVTGKGSAPTGGVLRREVPRWLGEPALRAGILGIVEARPKDGGAGALYVLLRKLKG